MNRTPLLRETPDWFGFGLVGQEDYYGALAVKRRDTPVEVTKPLSNSPSPLVVVYRYADVVKVISDEEAFSPDVVASQFRPVLGRRTMMALHGDELRHSRSVLGSFLSPRRSGELSAGIVRTVVTDTARVLAGKREADLVRELAEVVPSLVISRLLGLPDELAPVLLQHSLAMAGYLDDAKSALHASRTLRKLFAGIAAERHRKPGDDLISRLLAAPGPGALADDDVIALLMLLTWAGTETTYPALGSLFCALLTDDRQLKAVRDTPSLAQRAVDEVLRWETPVQATCRGTIQDSVIGDVPVPAGTTVLAHLGSANHDIPGVADPERFDVHRPGGIVHVAFGLGTHRCLGTQLARLEMTLTLDTVLAECPRLRLAPGCRAAIGGHFIRGPVALPVEL